MKALTIIYINAKMFLDLKVVFGCEFVRGLELGFGWILWWVTWF
jgi:hypothetical protein